MDGSDFLLFTSISTTSIIFQVWRSEKLKTHQHEKIFCNIIQCKTYWEQIRQGHLNIEISLTNNSHKKIIHKVKWATATFSHSDIAKKDLLRRWFAQDQAWVAFQKIIIKGSRVLQFSITIPLNSPLYKQEISRHKYGSRKKKKKKSAKNLAQVLREFEVNWNGQWFRNLLVQQVEEEKLIRKKESHVSIIEDLLWIPFP